MTDKMPDVIYVQYNVDFPLALEASAKQFYKGDSKYFHEHACISKEMSVKLIEQTKAECESKSVEQAIGVLDEVLAIIHKNNQIGQIYWDVKKLLENVRNGKGLRDE